MVPRVRTTQTRSPSNILYIPVDNTPVRSTPAHHELFWTKIPNTFDHAYCLRLLPKKVRKVFLFLHLRGGFRILNATVLCFAEDGHRGSKRIT